MKTIALPIDEDTYNRLSKNGKEAIRLVSLGLRVFPVFNVRPNGACSCVREHECKDTGKHPRTKNGFQDASTDYHKVVAWWTQCPEANVAIATGARRGN